MKLPITALFLLAATAVGCGGSSGDPPTVERGEEIRLEQVADVLSNFQFNKGKPPKSIKELRSFPGDSGGADLVASGAIVVNWGVELPDPKEAGGDGGASEEIVAYGKDVPTKGGPVLLRNRAVRRMTAEEFKAANQAKP